MAWVEARDYNARLDIPWSEQETVINADVAGALRESLLGPDLEGLDESLHKLCFTKETWNEVSGQVKAAMEQLLSAARPPGYPPPLRSA